MASKKPALHTQVVRAQPEAATVHSFAIDVEPNLAHRGYNEDRYLAVDPLFGDNTKALFCILDGHGGERAVDFA
jgi:hypothetical protein